MSNPFMTDVVEWVAAQSDRLVSPRSMFDTAEGNLPDIMSKGGTIMDQRGRANAAYL